MKDFGYAVTQIPGLIRYFKLDASAAGTQTDYGPYGRNSGGWGGTNPSAPGLPAPGYLLDQHAPTVGACFQTGHGFGNVFSWNGAQDGTIDNFTTRSWSFVFAGLKPHDMSVARSWHGVGSGGDIGGTLVINADGSITVTSNIANPVSSAAGVMKQYVPHLLIMSYDKPSAKITVYVGDWTGRWVTAINAATGADITTSAPFPLVGRNRNGSPTGADGFLDDYAVYANHAITSAEALQLFDAAGYSEASLTYTTTPGHRNAPINRAYPSGFTTDTNSTAASAELAGKADSAVINGAGGFNQNSFTTSIYKVTKAFRQNPANWLTLNAPIHYGDQSTFMAFEDAPVPHSGRPSLGFAPSVGSDSHLAIWCPETDEYWETGGASGFASTSATTATQDGTTAVLTAVPAAAWIGYAGVKNGRAVTGTGVQAGSTITANDSVAGTITLNLPTTAAGSAVAITILGTDAAPAWTMTYGTKQTGFSLFQGAIGAGEGATATGIPNMLGVPTIAELQNAIYNGIPIPHGLAGVMFDGKQTQVWPAVRHDGANNALNVIEGQFYRLKHDSVTSAAIAAMPHPTGRVMAQALQTYGLLIVDRNLFATLLQTEDKAQDIALGLNSYTTDPAGKPALGGIMNGQTFSSNVMQGCPWPNLELLDNHAMNPSDGAKSIRPAVSGLQGSHTPGKIQIAWTDDADAIGWNVHQRAATSLTLSSALTTGAAITTLPAVGIGEFYPSGTKITLSSGANSQTFITSGPSPAGDTAIAVLSQTPNFAYPTSSTSVVRKQVARSNWPSYTISNAAGALTLAITAINGGGESPLSVDFTPPTPLRSRRRLRSAVG